MNELCFCFSLIDEPSGRFDNIGVAADRFDQRFETLQPLEEFRGFLDVVEEDDLVLFRSGLQVVYVDSQRHLHVDKGIGQNGRAFQPARLSDRRVGRWLILVIDIFDPKGAGGNEVGSSVGEALDEGLVARRTGGLCKCRDIVLGKDIRLVDGFLRDARDSGLVDVSCVDTIKLDSGYLRCFPNSAEYKSYYDGTTSVMNRAAEDYECTTASSTGCVVSLPLCERLTHLCGVFGGGGIGR